MDRPNGQKGDYMKKNFGKQMKRRCLSLALVSALVICTPAADTLGSSGILPQIVQKAKAASGQINDNQKLNSDIIADAALLAYLRDKTGKGDAATVKDLRSANLRNITVPAEVHDLTGLGYALSMTTLDLSLCKAVEINEDEFNGCTALTQVKLPASVTRIDKNAFNGCTSLETIDLSQVDYFGDSAFGGCSKLTNESVGSMKSTVKEMGTAVFSGCKVITEAKVPIITGENAHMVPAQMFNNCEMLENVIFCDDKITGILDQAFAATGALTFGTDKSNKLPSTIESVGQGAFSASKITSIDLKQTKMTWISKNTFMNSQLAEVTLPDKLTDIREEAFESSRIEEIVMPNTVEKIGEASFRYAGNLLRVKLSVNITEIPRYAFQMAGSQQFTGDIDNITNWDDLIDGIEGMKVTYNGNASDSKLEKIGVSAFNASTICNEDFLKDLTKLDSIGEFAFSYTDFKKLTIPASVTTLGESSFAGMYEMKSVVFAKGSKVTEFPKELFGSSKTATDKKTYADLVLESVQLPDGLESIGEDCFGNCWSLETIGYSGKMIEGELHFPETLKTIEKKAFENSGFYEITKYDEDGVGYAAKYCVPVYPGGYRAVYIPDSVTTIGDGAFQNCRMMEEIYFGDGLTELPADVCAGAGSYPYKENTTSKVSEKDCLVTPTPVPSGENGELGKTTYNPITFVGLKTVKLPKNVKTIGNNAFKECYALEGFYDPDANAVTGDFTGALEEIGNNAFLSCKSLEDVILPSSLVKIGDYAFAQTSQDVSSSVTSLSTRRSVSFYTQYTGLGNVDFRFAENLESIGRGAFQRSNISQIDFRSEKLEEIPASVCEDCYNLERISIPDTVKKINQNAFRNTYKLDSVTVPLSSEWSDQLFSGVAGYAKQKVTVIANPVTKEKNIYHQQENAVDFNCVKNFRDMSITVTDELKDKNDETGDLLNNDSNEFVTVRKEDDSSGRYQAISMYGKKQGDAKVRVSGTIRLEGDIHSENNTTALNDARLVLQVSQLYNIHVAQNPISVLTLSAERLAQEAKENVIYLEYGSKNAVDLKASYMGEDSSEETTDSITWIVDNASVATIDGTPIPAQTTTPEGEKMGMSTIKLLPQALGDTKVVAKSSSEKSAECKIRVRLALDRISLSRRNVGIDVNKEFTLSVDENNYSKDNAKLLEQNPGCQDVYRFSSSNEDVVTIDPITGKAKSVAEGEATIKAVSLVSGRSDSCTVKVQAGYVSPAESVKLSEKELTINVGEQASLTATVLPEDAVQSVEWSSSDDKIATVAGGVVTGKQDGTVTIKAKAENGVSATCKVKVKVPVASVTLNKTELFLEVGGSESLKAEVLPKEATDKKITWTTSDENIATVSSSGNVKGVKVGSATITATADGKCVTCTVKVGAVAESVVISAPQKKVAVGGTVTLTASVTPSDANQAIEWKSSDEKIATVVNGVVTGVKIGVCNITAKASGSSKEAVCKVIVTAPKVKLTKVKNVKKKSIQIKWKKIADVAGYQVSCGKKKKLTTANSIKIKKLKKKKKYAVKVRAYTVVDGKNVYGKWSKVKKVKIKK